MVEYGLLANVLSTTALFPQLYKTIKTRSVDDMSYTWLLLSVVANAFWIVYALRQKKKEVLFMGSVFTLFYGTLLVVKTMGKKEGMDVLEDGSKVYDRVYDSVTDRIHGQMLDREPCDEAEHRVDQTSGCIIPDQE